MLKAAKYYSGPFFLTIAFAAFIFLTSEEKISVESSAVIISDSSFRADILESYAFDIKELKGIRVANPQAGNVSYYFEYEADYREILNTLSTMPFRISDNRISFQCGVMESNVNPLDNAKSLSEEELKASSFFWKALPEEYVFYECLKGSVKHTVLVSKTSSRMLHWIAVV